MIEIKADRTVKALLAVIALSLAILAGNALMSLAVPEARAAKSDEDTVPTKQIDVRIIKRIPAAEVTEILTLGDQKTFIVRQKDAVSVVRVDYFDN